ncbi:MAG: hypothetical protein HYX96_06780 [Chloroflexi bacterium]|nr:hypothetical protein [Chloroflexota bacterium]
MSKLLTRVGGLILGLLMLWYLLPAPVSALGLGVAPPQITIIDAVSGQVYEENFAVYNTDELEGDYALSTEGDIADWVSFYRLEDPATPVETISISAKTYAWVKAKFSIPQEASEPEYEGVMYVTGEEMETGGQENMVNTVSVQLPIKVKIELAGTVPAEGEVTAINLDNREAGMPLSLEISFNNTGTVWARPRISMDILSGGRTVTNITHNQTRVETGKQQTIKLQWNTAGMKEGVYVADIQVALGSKVIEKKKLEFTLLPPVALTGVRRGELMSLSTDSTPGLGDTAKLQALFINFSRDPLRVKFIGEVYLNGKQVDTVESEEVTIMAGVKQKIDSFVTVAEAGQYEVKGYVDYGGERTDAMSVSFSVAGQGLGQKSILLLVLGLVGVSGAGAFVWVLRRRR